MAALFPIGYTTRMNAKLPTAAKAHSWRSGPSLGRAVRRGREHVGAKAWLRRNRAALDAYNRHIEEHGVFSEGLRSF